MPSATKHSPTRNSANSGGGIHCIATSVLDVRNSIIYGNSADTWDNCFIGAGATFTAVCADPWVPGPGNTAKGPNFVSPQSGDFRLLPGSPCINTGMNDAWMETAGDLDGKQRIANGVVDMGPYESEVGPLIGNAIADVADGTCRVTSPLAIRKGVEVRSVRGAAWTALDGFTIKNGYAVGQNGLGGGGAFLYGAGLLRNSTVVSNTTTPFSLDFARESEHFDRLTKAEAVDLVRSKARVSGEYADYGRFAVDEDGFSYVKTLKETRTEWKGNKPKEIEYTETLTRNVPWSAVTGIPPYLQQFQMVLGDHYGLYPTFDVMTVEDASRVRRSEHLEFSCKNRQQLADVAAALRTLTGL